MTCFCDFLGTVVRVYSNAFDADAQTVEGPLEDIPGASRGDRLIIDVETRGRNDVRGRQYLPSATYVSEFVQTLPVSGGSGVESIQGLRWLELGGRSGTRRPTLSR